ncbi:MAG TPA: caspase family protein, partial [Thermoanaerobaculia bacterium]
MAALFAAPGLIAGVRPVGVDATAADAPVAAADSAALFVGVREFPDDDTLAEVRYAVDDAIDLAYVLAIDGNPRLVEPRSVILALSGAPQKKESGDRLKALVAAGASVKTARHADVLKLLRAQAAAVGAQGLLIVAFATHGISENGTQYLLTESSLLRDRETAVPETKIREIVAEADVPRSLILLDACRQRLVTNTREGLPDPRSAAGLMRALGSVSGQVVFSAAAAGEYAYDDDLLRNGVFTSAVIDGLRCAAPRNEQGFVTVDTLSEYVENRVLAWV